MQAILAKVNFFQSGDQVGKRGADASEQEWME
jgi:hypothetical protein